MQACREIAVLSLIRSQRQLVCEGLSLLCCLCQTWRFKCIVLASHLCTCVLHRHLCYLHTLKLPQFFHFHGDFHQKWHFAHPEVSLAHPELPFLAKSMFKWESLMKYIVNGWEYKKLWQELSIVCKGRYSQIVRFISCIINNDHPFPSQSDDSTPHCVHRLHYSIIAPNNSALFPQ